MTADDVRNELTEKVAAMEKTISVLRRENAELSCDGTQAREALTRARAKIEKQNAKIKELEERLANCDPGSGIDCGARIDTIEKMVVDASPEEAAALARVGIEDNDRLQYLYTLSSTTGEEVEGAAPTIKSLVQILDHLAPWQLVGADRWTSDEWTLFVRVKGNFDTKTRSFHWRPRGLNKPELELLDMLLNPLYGSPEEID
jgi:hypothetical protein